MNSNRYAENPNVAKKIVFMEDFEYVQEYLRFYRDSKGFTKFYQDDRDKILKSARKYWQNIMNSINANAVYYGGFGYGKILDYLNIIKKLLIIEENKKCSMVEEWNEKYPNLLTAYEKLELIHSEEEFEEVFIEYFNELRIAANKEFLKLMSWQF